MSVKRSGRTVLNWQQASGHRLSFRRTATLTEEQWRNMLLSHNFTVRVSEWNIWRHYVNTDQNTTNANSKALAVRAVNCVTLRTDVLRPTSLNITIQIPLCSCHTSAVCQYPHLLVEQSRQFRQNSTTWLQNGRHENRVFDSRWRQRLFSSKYLDKACTSFFFKFLPRVTAIIVDWFPARTCKNHNRLERCIHFPKIQSPEERHESSSANRTS